MTAGGVSSTLFMVTMDMKKLYMVFLIANPITSLAAPAPSHNVRVWYASYIPSCTGLPKTGATNQNAPRLISEYLCLLRQRNDLNSITIVKETRESRGKL